MSDDASLVPINTTGGQLAFPQEKLPKNEWRAPRVSFDLQLSGRAPFIYMPEGTYEHPPVTRALGKVLTRRGMADPQAWEDLLAACGTRARVFLNDRRGERWELRGIDIDYGGETGKLIVRHLGPRSREGDIGIDLHRAYGHFLPVVVYKPGGGLAKARNPGDDELRRLERAAQAGDPRARGALRRERKRRGIPDPTFRGAQRLDRRARQMSGRGRIPVYLDGEDRWLSVLAEHQAAPVLVLRRDDSGDTWEGPWRVYRTVNHRRHTIGGGGTAWDEEHIGDIDLTGAQSDGDIVRMLQDAGYLSRRYYDSYEGDAPPWPRRRNPGDEELRRLERAVRAGEAGAAGRLVRERRRRGLPRGGRALQRLATARRLTARDPLPPAQAHDELDMEMWNLKTALDGALERNRWPFSAQSQPNVYYSREGHPGGVVNATLPRAAGRDGREASAWMDFYVERRLNRTWAIIIARFVGGSRMFEDEVLEGRDIDPLIAQAVAFYEREVRTLSGGLPPTRRNPQDEDIRRLERAAAQGDVVAQQKLQAARERALAVPRPRGSYVFRPGKKPKAVKNTGSLLREAGQQIIEKIEVHEEHRGGGDALLRVWFRDGTMYETAFADRGVLWRWLQRPVFEGVERTWFGTPLGPIQKWQPYWSGSQHEGRPITRRANPGADEELRRLEREAIQKGDKQAAVRLANEWVRRGDVKYRSIVVERATGRKFWLIDSPSRTNYGIIIGIAPVTPTRRERAQARGLGSKVVPGAMHAGLASMGYIPTGEMHREKAVRAIVMRGGEVVHPECLSEETKHADSPWRGRSEQSQRYSWPRGASCGICRGASGTPRRRNPGGDEERRRLERAAQAGDPRAAARLHAARQRVGGQGVKWLVFSKHYRLRDGAGGKYLATVFLPPTPTETDVRDALLRAGIQIPKLRIAPSQNGVVINLYEHRIHVGYMLTASPEDEPGTPLRLDNPGRRPKLTLIVSPHPREPEHTRYLWKEQVGTWQMLGQGAEGTYPATHTPEQRATKAQRMVEAARKHGYEVFVDDRYLNGMDTCGRCGKDFHARSGEGDGELHLCPSCLRGLLRGLGPLRNPPGEGDELLRRLERAAQAGDPRARGALRRERQRRGIPDHTFRGAKRLMKMARRARDAGQEWVFSAGGQDYWIVLPSDFRPRPAYGESTLSERAHIELFRLISGPIFSHIPLRAVADHGTWNWVVESDDGSQLTAYLPSGNRMIPVAQLFRQDPGEND